MRAKTWLVPFMAVVVAAAVTGCAKASASSTSGGLPEVSADLAPGKKVFQDTCSSCHGATGLGGYGANLTTSALVAKETEQSLYEFLAKNHVPALQDSQHLTDEQLQAAAKFIKVLKKN